MTGKLETELENCIQIDRGDFVEFWQKDHLLQCTFKDGWKVWFNELIVGSLHRENGPAVIKPDGSQFYYHNGKLHRENGPAIIRNDGSTEFWINGKKIN